MGLKVTRKQIADNHFCVAVGYCQLQHLLSYANCPYYTAGVYGWNFGAYTFEYKGCNVAICTGYRGMPGKHLDYNAEHEFDERARKIIQDNLECSKQRELIDNLIQEFLAVVFPEL